MTLFFVFNGVGLLIAVGILAISHYVLGLRSPLEDNISANGVGLVAGMVFRFWSYRTFVFKGSAGSPGQADPEPLSRDRLPDGEAEAPVHT